MLAWATDQVGHLPWSITVHFSHFPVDQILPCQAREQVESVFMSSLKEADQLKHSGKVVSMMQKKDHNQLWLGLLSDKFDQFWAIYRLANTMWGKLIILIELMYSMNNLFSPRQEDMFKNIPIWFYLAGNDNTMSRNIVQRQTGHSWKPDTVQAAGGPGEGDGIGEG